MKVSPCVDCATTILGDALRCPACHEAHAHMLEEDAITAPRPRTDEIPLPGMRMFLTWLVGAEIVAAIICGMILAVRGC
jgi:hypothetical protein